MTVIGLGTRNASKIGYFFVKKNKPKSALLLQFVGWISRFESKYFQRSFIISQPESQAALQGYVKDVI